MALSTSQAQASSLRLQKIVLSWDYWDLESCTEEGSGAIKDLKKVPNTFSSIQVHELTQAFIPLHCVFPVFPGVLMLAGVHLYL